MKENSRYKKRVDGFYPAETKSSKGKTPSAAARACRKAFFAVLDTLVAAVGDIEPSLAAKTTAIPINFGTIAQLSQSVTLSMDSGGTVRVTGGSANLEGIASPGILRIEGQLGKYEQIENISVTPGKSVTLDGCTVTLSSVIPGKNEPFSITNPNSDYCRSQVPQKYDIPFAAVLAIAGGYCAEGTYSLANVAQTAWDEYICNYNMSTGVCYGTSNCPMMGNRFADVPVTFTVKKPLQAVEEQSLDFGTIIAMPYLQAITVDTNGNVSGNAVPVGSETSVREGRFAVIGAAGKTVNITVPAAAKIISTQGGGAEMEVRLIAGADSIVLGDAGGAGRGTFTVGGILQVGAGQPEGTYAGTYTVQVSY